MLLTFNQLTRDRQVNLYNKTRIAPTPSGFLHLGNVLSFVITTALARKHSAKILLRIDDLDQARVNENYIRDIFDTLNFLEIPWDEGPRNIKEFENGYSQLHRMSLYVDALKQLEDSGVVFGCTCTRQGLANTSSCTCLAQKIPLNTSNVNWRLKTDSAELEVKDYNGQIISAVLPAEMTNFVVKKKDDFPSYQLASIIDDLFYGVDLVVRGDDLWPSTLAQHALSAMLKKNDFGDITFYHHPVITETSGKKLSKSAGATSIKYLRENGKTPADVYILIAGMLGINETVNSWQQLAEVINQ